jgi:hypothetical protein
VAFTWEALLSQVKFRLNRPDLPTDYVEQMAGERVTVYGPYIFYPSETLDYSITTQPGQYFYRLPPGTQQVNYVRVLYGGIWIPVPIADRITDILESDPLQPPFTSIPVTLAKVYGDQLRLFPTPTGQYPVELTALITPGVPTDPNDSSSFWVTAGRVLLINGTAAEICSEYLDISVPNSPRVATFKANAQMALEQLMTQSHQRSSPSIIKSWL